ncbi:MAG: permease [Planctomycetota bacterium]|nr:permease [Planctomycetota bacterium]
MPHTKEDGETGGLSACGSTGGPSASDMIAGMALVVVCSACLLPFVVPGNRGINDFSVVFSSIALEAMPFMLLGALIGGAIEVFVSRERMTALLPGSDWASACVAAALGVLFPVCECAIVPVVRRLGGKGLPAAAAIAYLLAGPIVNPVAGLSTAMAYNFDWRPVAVRLGFGYLIAVGVALILARVFGRGSLFGPGVEHGKHSDHAHHEHDGHSRCRTCGCGHDHETGGGGAGRIAAVCNHALDDFMATAPYLVAGAAIAAIAQTCLERRLFLDMASSPMLSSAAMALLAILLNLCSEADAFIAASFRGLIPFSAQMVFLVVGPMFDIKLLLMYRGLFRTRVVPLLAILVVAAAMLMSVMLDIAGAIE